MALGHNTGTSGVICKWSIESRGGLTECGHEAVDRVVLNAVCEQCRYGPYRKEPDYFSATEKLLVTKQRTGEYKPVSRRCGGCDEKKRTRDSGPPLLCPDTFLRPDDDWCVAVTTAPRHGHDTLSDCLQSIRLAGWREPIVFAEPDVDVPDNCKVQQNLERRGCFHNWLHSARWALENTTAEMILCVQDDAVFHPHSRIFAEQHCLWPADAGFVSLYTPAHYSRKTKKTMRPTGVNKIVTSSLWGTLAIIWRRSVLQQVVEHPTTLTWLGIAPKKRKGEKLSARKQRVRDHYDQRRLQPALINNSDYLAGKVVTQLGKKMYFVDPSPVSHVAKISTIGHGGNSGRRNCLRCGDHAIPLETQVFG